MRLTKYDRNMILKKIMDDVPRIDYHGQIEAVLRREAHKKLPAPIQRIWDNSELRGYLDLTQHGHRAGSADDMDWYYYVGDTIEVTPEVQTEIDALADAGEHQESVLSNLRNKLRLTLDSCTTTQAFIKRLPEFEKYVGKEEATSKNLPALANLVTDFIKAGWPKGNAA